jgi:hypothetical protein
MPIGFRASILTGKMTWQQWRKLHPGTKVMAMNDGPAGAKGRRAPKGPVLPYYPMPHPSRATRPESGSLPMENVREDASVVMIATTRPAGEGSVAIPAGEVTSRPLNLSVDGEPIVLFRDPASGALRAFDRHLGDDPCVSPPIFLANTDPRRAGAGVALVDSQANVGWNAQGVAVDGGNEWRGRRLKVAGMDEDRLYWGVMRFWYPGLQLRHASDLVP